MPTNTSILLILILDPHKPRLYTREDSRSIDELVKLVNTGQLVIGADQPELSPLISGRGQWAFRLDPANMISVTLGRPPVTLSPRQYDVLFGLGQGLKADQIAERLGISRRRVYQCKQALKERFQAGNFVQVLVKAVDCGYLWIDEFLCLSSDHNNPSSQVDPVLLADDEPVV